MLDIQNSFLLMSALFNAGLVVFIIRGWRQRSTSLYFSAFLFFLFVWAIALINFDLSDSITIAVYSAKISYLAALIIAVSFYLFSIIFPEGTRPTRRTFLVIGVITIVYIIVLFSPDILIREVIFDTPTGKGVVLGIPEYLAFVVLFFTLFVGGLLRLWIKFFKAHGLPRRRLLVIALSVSVAGAAGMYYNLILPSPFLNEFTYLWTGPIFTTFIGASVVYSVFRLGLFDARIIATELLIFLLWIFTFLRTFLASDTREQIFNGGLFLLALIIGILLNRSVKKEIRAREEIERLALNLEQANERLKELDKLKSEFVSIASHQLRAPLTSIKGYASLILESSFGKVSESVREAVQKIFDSSETMVSSVEDFLNVSRIEQGRMKYRFAAADAAKVARSVIDVMKPTVMKKGLTLSYSDDKESSYPIKADIGKFTQVLTNLVDNAIKYTPHGTIGIQVTKNNQTKKVRIAIADTGIGMSDKTISQIFDKFTRAETAADVNAGGTGLGLYVAAKIIKAHHGRIWAESEGEGKGSVFCVELNLLKIK